MGKPVAHCEVRIADAQGDAVADGTVGRILIRGDNVSPGYHDDPELTAASRTADGFLDTGDLGTIHEGELVITGRVKDILFVGGQNHYPQDIDLILSQHAGMELGRVAAAGTRAPHSATDDVLVFLLHKGDDLAAFAESSRTVRRVISERMGLPVAAVVPVRQFPKTTSGKVQRFALARDYEEGRFADVLAELARHDTGAASPEAAAANDAGADAACDLPGGAARPEAVARRQSLRDRHRLAHARADLRTGREHVSRLSRGHRLLRVSHRARDGGIPRAEAGGGAHASAPRGHEYSGFLYFHFRLSHSQSAGLRRISPSSMRA